MDTSDGPHARQSGAPIQQVGDVELAEFEKQESDYLRRLDVDRSIVGELRKGGFVGKDYDYFANELAKYGIAVINAWCYRGTIFAKVGAKGFGGLPQLPDDTLRQPDNAVELAQLCVADALASFRTSVLLPNKWDPAKGASIRTYFIGHCLLRFANVYRRWHSETIETGWINPGVLNEKMVSATAEDSYRAADDRIEVERLLQAIPSDRTREYLAWYGAGHTYAEIAAAFNVTPKTVEMAVRHAREGIQATMSKNRNKEQERKTG
ncbi:Fis family transcriptional regulator [Humibacter ginsengiterrae]